MATAGITTGCAPSIRGDVTEDAATSSTSTTAVCTNTVPSSIISWWDGDLISDPTAQDRIGGSSSNDGTMSNVSSLTGYVSNAFSLNGTTAKISVPDAASLNPSNALTISAWVKSNLNTRSSNAIQTLLSKWGFNSGGLATAGNWAGVDIAGASALNSVNYRGFRSGVFDGRYIYFVRSDSAIDNYVARYDTQGSLAAPGSWVGVDIAGALALNDANYKGFSGAVFDGRYIYFVPAAYNGVDYSSHVARYDTQGSLTTPSSWAGVDIAGALALNSVSYKGFNGAIFDGRYVYFVPYYSGVGVVHGDVARYDTQGSLTAPSSWAGVNTTSASALNDVNYQGFGGAVFDGRYIYFVPYRGTGGGPAGKSGYVARYDTQGSLTAPGSWAGVDIAGASALNSANYKGFSGAVFDGRYVYFVPWLTSLGGHGDIARYDTQGSLTAPGSWAGVDIAGASGLNNASYKGFSGAIFDGRYVYFVPSTSNPGVFHGDVARYDTQGSLTAPGSWAGVDIAGASALNNANYKGFSGAVFDGRNIYFVPSVTTSGYMAQYDTIGTAASYSLNYSESTRGDGFSSSLAGTSFVINTTTGPLSVFSQTEITAGSWHHVAATYDGSTLSLYIDGALAASRAGTGLIQSSTSNVTIGSITDGNGYFNGLVDEVQIYSAALSATEISALHAAGANGQCK